MSQDLRPSFLFSHSSIICNFVCLCSIYMGLFDKGVQKTRRSFFEKITRVVAGHSRVSDGLLDNIEEALVASDMGVDTTLRIIDRLEDRVAADRYLTTEELLGMLHEEIASLLEIDGAVQEKEEEDVVAKETREDKNAAADKTLEDKNTAADKSLEDKNAAVQSKVLGAVDIENVCFSYVPNKKLIENFSLNVRPGQRIAIVGPTGCGKTTLINLLMRFYDVNSGNIYLDGKEIRSMSRMQLRQSIGMVLQETWLRAGTIRDNIAMGKPDATDEEIIMAAKQAHAHSFIERLQNGYQTIVKEEGGNLSNGQKQLLCIARVMLINPPMLILDEATSSIDTRTEMKVQDAFLHLMENKTSFIVAHRLSTIRSADVILVMKDGNIIEQGSHEELLQKKGFYYNLYQSQWA